MDNVFGSAGGGKTIYDVIETYVPPENQGEAGMYFYQNIDIE